MDKLEIDGFGFEAYLSQEDGDSGDDVFDNGDGMGDGDGYGLGDGDGDGGGFCVSRSDGCGQGRDDIYGLYDGNGYPSDW